MKTTNLTKKSNIAINATSADTGTLTVSKAFYKRASVYGTAEYVELHSAMCANPKYTIEFKTIEKKSYHGLTFKVMETYIKTQPDSEKILVKFAAVKRVAKAKGSLYPLTKKWFLSTFPDYKENEVSEAETDALIAEAEAEMDAILSDSNNELNEVA